MDRRRASGIALVLVSAAAFGSGSLFAQPVYAAGVDWLTLSAWRFLFGAGLTWASCCSRRIGAGRFGRRIVGRSSPASRLGVMYVGNSGTYYASLETVSPSLAALVVYLYPAVVAVLSIRFGAPAAGPAGVDRARASRSSASCSRSAASTRTTRRRSAASLLAFASCFIYAVWVILAARISGERRETVAAASGQAGSATVAVAIIMTATAMVYWVAALATGRPVLPGQIPSAAWVGLIGVGVGGDVHRHPDVLRGRPAGRRRARLAHQPRPSRSGRSPSRRSSSRWR